MLGLYRKGRKNTLAYHWHNRPAHGTETQVPCWIALTFENHDAVKNYLLTLDPEAREEYEVRTVTLKAQCQPPRS